MVSVEKALELVLAQKREFGTERVSLLSATGRILAQPVLADRDFPPFDRVTMDGVALLYDSFCNGQMQFTIENIQAAGAEQTTLDNNDGCIEVMTGAILPVNTDVVIPYEECKIDNGNVIISAKKVSRRQNIHSKGSDAKKSTVLVERFTKITPAIAGILASVGLFEVNVLKLPKIAICSTGEELVDIQQVPELHQIRRSNLYALAAELIPINIDVSIDHLPDEPEQMKKQVLELIKNNNALLFSGAVSAGKFDYLPSVLRELGMQIVFHKVAQKPGKPFLFGYFKDGPVVFGFPGNPISTFVCFHVFFIPWLQESLKQKKTKQVAILTKDVQFIPLLDYHLLVETSVENGTLEATPVSGTNSGDLVALAKANGLITLPSAKNIFTKGEAFPFLFF